MSVIHVMNHANGPGDWTKWYMLNGFIVHVHPLTNLIGHMACHRLTLVLLIAFAHITPGSSITGDERAPFH